MEKSGTCTPQNHEGPLDVGDIKGIEKGREVTIVRTVCKRCRELVKDEPKPADSQKRSA